MKTILFKAIFTTVGFVVTASCGFASAELPPGAYKELKREAKEVLQLQVTKVRKVREDESVQYFICEATVVAVERSAAGHKKGDSIQFETFYVYDKSHGFAGPQSPPRLQVEWSGRVYLNPPVEDHTEALSLAAYGQSFEKLRQRRRHGLFRRR